MAKIPFSIDYRPQIELGEYKVVTGDDRPVRIISWDKKAYGGRCDIVALVPESQGDTETVQLYYPNGALLSLSHNEKFKLFIVTPEPELTEFEKELESFYNHHLQVCTYDNQGTVEDSLHDGASKLLALARKQLQPEIDAEIEKAYKTADEVMYRKGKEDGIVEARNDISARIIALKQAKDRAEEALKDLPRWMKENSFRTEGTFIGIKGKEYFVVKDGYSVPMTELLTKLPGFKEDEK